MKRLTTFRYVFLLLAVLVGPASAQWQATADFNGDGRPDIVTAQGTYMNQGGTLGPLVPFGLSGSRSLVAVGDFNGDGKQDVAVAGPDLVILLGNGNGTFQAPLFPTLPNVVDSMAAADFNGDGKTDLVVLDRAARAVRVLSASAGGAFQVGSAIVPQDESGQAAVIQWLATADMDADGRPDFVVSFSFSPDAGFIRYLNLGDGSFLAFPMLRSPGIWLSVQHSPYETFSLTDVNGDGFPDLLQKNRGEDGSSSLTIYTRRSGDLFTFSALPVASGTGAVAAGDFNGDGLVDIAVNVSYDRLLSLALANGDGTYRVTNYAAGLRAGDRFLTAVDLDGDGISEITSQETTLRPDAEGRFNFPVNYSAGSGGPRYMAVADFNSDGKPDIAAGNGYILTNDGTGGYRGPSPELASSYPGLGSHPIAVDLNLDGKVDLVSGFGFKLGNGDGTFQSVQILPVSGQSPWVNAGDFDGDGRPDLVRSGSPTVVSYGNGDGTFSSAEVFLPSGGLARIIDFDGDGRTDLAIASSPSLGGQPNLDNLVMYRAAEGRSFARVWSFCCLPILDMSAMDVDRDGRLDLLVTTMPSGLIVFRNSGDGNFVNIGTYATAEFQDSGLFPTTTLAILDFNRDGYPDLAVHTRDGVEVFLGQEAGLVRQPLIRLSNGATSSLVAADVDGDGDDDLIAFRPNHWLFVSSQTGAQVIINRNPAADATHFAQFAATPQPAIIGQPVTFTWQVAANVGVPTGSVQLLDGTTALASVPLDASGRGSFSSSTLSAGQHALRAVYSSEGVFVGSEAALTVTVQNPSTKQATSTTLQITPSDPDVGQLVTLTAKVTAASGIPAGSVTFTSQTGSVLGMAALNGSGVAQLQVRFSKPGAQRVTATYAENVSFFSSTSATVMVVVKPAKGK